ncbi:putative nitronate monooxygenase [Beauveria bassiana D1-5]|uniref:Putative nitronate monooxygenase n=1 Tax=Beauveria bassiana D1-5 TaxID=1245745 RepID=A0A0A2VD55_BEABA|nr:putative nitronate monooxygenase [Beauveria bassiana D1-5]
MLRTAATNILGIKHPVILAGMDAVASPKLAAAVTNAGGLGVFGGVNYTPEAMREALAELKSNLDDKSAPFGVDLLIPQIGGSARKTNHDYSHGNLDELITIIIESGAKLFVSAVGLPPKRIVDRLHDAGILYMNMIGHPRHAQKAIDNGADLLCAQGGEGGGHTGDIATVILVPAVAKLIKGQKSAFTGREVVLVAAGGLFNGQSLAAVLMLGASAAWVGTRFILAAESGASKHHQETLKKSTFGDVIRTTAYTGRPCNVHASTYIRRWEEERRQEMLDLQAKGIIAVQHDLDTKPDDDEVLDNAHFMAMGRVAGLVDEVQPARRIVEDMVAEACTVLSKGQRMMEKL